LINTLIMIIKITINKHTSQWTTDDETVVVNHFFENDDEFVIEVSKPDPDQTTITPWQQ
jgi:hypothetical protein